MRSVWSQVLFTPMDQMTSLASPDGGEDGGLTGGESATPAWPFDASLLDS